MELKQLIIYSGIYLALFTIVEILYHKAKLPTELTRKIVHIASGLIALSFPLFFNHIINVAILCGAFLVILYASKPLGLLSSINNVERETKGSTLFPIIVCVCFWIYEIEQLYLFYYLPILILAICDPIAALVGKRLKFGEYTIMEHNKTLAGNMGFFISCFVLCFSIAFISYSDLVHPLVTAFALSVLCTIAEGVSINGYDNITIPGTVIGTLYIIKLFFI